jgi:outer membrane murein-binding lipoprotein Lpp
MKRCVVLVVLVALALSGCASGRFLGFLATTDYVDAKAKALSDQQSAEIGSLKAQLEQAKAAVEQVNQTKKTIDELQALARRAEAKIASIPKDVIRQIVDILQSALNE